MFGIYKQEGDKEAGTQGGKKSKEIETDLTRDSMESQGESNTRKPSGNREGEETAVGARQE